ncbi:hypothetical protein L195_g036355 [Trifolium pratense]|uniref:Uncharacterized protein n=1 Tax=Trifolium pratense TaxID=57577 RepID=A0A2K3LP88_TRIPR|nr:hypothetical protein L195_g036355 [Trifolium pratense]
MSCFKGATKSWSQDEKIDTNGIDDLKKPLFSLRGGKTPRY